MLIITISIWIFDKVQSENYLFVLTRSLHFYTYTIVFTNPSFLACLHRRMETCQSGKWDIWFQWMVSLCHSTNHW